MKINSDDESIPYKKEMPEDSPEPTEPVQVVDNGGAAAYPYQYDQPQTSTPNQQWDGQQQPATSWVDQPGQSSEQYDGQAQLLPPPPPPPEGQWDSSQGQRQPLNQPQARQWTGETEIN